MHSYMHSYMLYALIYARTKCEEVLVGVKWVHGNGVEEKRVFSFCPNCRKQLVEGCRIGVEGEGLAVKLENARS